MLKKIADESDQRDSLLQDLDAKKSAFNVFGQIKNICDNQFLFMTKFFKLYSNPNGNDADLNKCFSLNDLKDMDSPDL